MGEGEVGDSAPETSQPDTAVSIDASSSDIPAKKLARQLDFTGFGRMSASVVFSEYPHPQSQTQLQSRSQLPLVAVPQSQAQLPPPPQSRPQMVVMPVSSSPRVTKPDSPKSRARSNIEAKDCTPKKQKQCNCKHSRCLKLYCECFASGIYCDGCNCINCYNNVENEAARREAVEVTLERNPNAFRPKIANSPHGTRDNREEAGEVLMLAKHNKGCHCKKSGCLKKYCECFQANILCSENCKCMDCKNFEGSEERQALFHGDHGNNIAYIQQAANAAITGAIGSSGYASPPVSKKRKGRELLFAHTPKDPAIHRLAQSQQENEIRTSMASLPSITATRAGSNGALGPSKVTYRSLLADIIQPQDLKELCSVLVVLSSEAAKTLADQRNAENQVETSVASSTHDRLQNEKDSAEKAMNGDCSSANEDNIVNNYKNTNSEEANVPKGQPMSPGTLALMCDEEDTLFIQSSFPNGMAGNSCPTSSQMPQERERLEVYAEQERIVFTKFRDCLNKLITFGKIKETNCSFQARNDIGNHKDQLCNGSIISQPEGRSQQRHEPVIINGTGMITAQQTSPTANSSSAIPLDVLQPKIQSLPEKRGNQSKGRETRGNKVGEERTRDGLKRHVTSLESSQAYKDMR